MGFEERLNFITHGIIEGKNHLESIYGSLEENLKNMNENSKEFQIAHLTGMLEVIQYLLGEEE
jgi:hypothetical protein